MPPGFNARSAAPERVLADRVEDDVVGLAVLGEVLLQVVDHLVGAERTHELDVLRAAHGGDVGAEVLRQLDPRRPDRTGRAVDEDPLALAGAPPAAGTLSARQRAVADRARPPRSSSRPACARAGAAPARRCTPRARRKPRWERPNTRSPTSNSVTAAPTASTSPASSCPRIVRFGRRSPDWNRQMNGSPAEGGRRSGYARRADPDRGSRRPPGPASRPPRSAARPAAHSDPGRRPSSFRCRRRPRGARR